MMIASEGTGEIRSMKLAVVFDPRDGTILHVQAVVTMEGADETSEAELERHALASAAERGLVAHAHNVLHVDPTQLETHERYRVNTGTRALEPDHEPQRGDLPDAAT